MQDSAGDGFVGRMTPQGWLLIQHLNRVSSVVTNAESDAVGLDAEAMWTWALVHSKVRDTKAFKARWPALVQDLQDLQAKAAKGNASPGEVSAVRLQIRMEQFECLISAAVEAHMLDVAALPVDDQR